MGSAFRGPLIAAVFAGLAVAGLAIASCGGSGEGAPTGDAGAPGEAAPELIVRAIYDRGDGAGEGLFAVDPLLPGDDAASEPARLPDEGFNGGDAQFPFVYTQDMVAYRCNAGACVVDPVADDGTRAVLGDAWCIAPSTAPGRVWLAELDPDQPAASAAIGSAREVGVADGAVHAELDLPARYLHCPVGSFEDGLLFQDGRGLIALDARGGQRRIPDPSPIAAHGSLVLSYDERRPLSLRLTDLATGEERRLRAPSGWRFGGAYNGAISPDGSVAAALVERDGEDGGHGTRVAIVGLDSGRVRVAGPVGGPTAGSLSFSADGDWLYALGGPGGEGRRGFPTEITAYPVAGDTPYVTPTGLRLLHMRAFRP